MQATHLDAETRYELYREEARILAFSALPQNIKQQLALSKIDQKALNDATLWSDNDHREVDWDWKFGHRIYSYRYPKRFELAIWHNNTLCSLTIGRPSYHGSRIRLDFTERMPENCPTKGYTMQIVILAAEAYARLIGAKEVRLMHPMNQSLVNYYQQFDYTYVQGSQPFDVITEKSPHYLYKIL